MMNDFQKLLGWLSKNKQVGCVISFNIDGEACWSSVAVQKWQDEFVVYVDEILESQMNAENYIREELHHFSDVDQALDFILTNTKATIEQLVPCKGQKIFNPD